MPGWMYMVSTKYRELFGFLLELVRKTVPMSRIDAVTRILRVKLLRWG